MKNDLENNTTKETNNDASKVVALDKRLIYNVLIVLALGVGFGKIASVDSVPDRAIQNYRLQQIPKTMEAKAKELQSKGVEGERFEEEMKRVYVAAMADAKKARPTFCANDRSRWATIRALVEPKMTVYRYAPVFSDEEKQKRLEELIRNNPNNNGVVEFKYYPNEILRNCADSCPDKYEEANFKAERYRKIRVPYAIDKVWESYGWDSIDVVKHGLKDEVYQPENPSSGYLYSSKPTLLPTVMAVPYWLLFNCAKLSLDEKPFETVKILLLFYNLIPLGVAFFCLTSIIDRLGTTDWGKICAICALLFGSFTLTFVATLNNHIPGFACVSIALWATIKIIGDGKNHWGYYALAGFFGAFAVACELPALAFAAALCLWLLCRKPMKTLAVSIPFGLIVVVAFISTDYIAHQSLTPAYAHKRNHMELEMTTQARDTKQNAELQVEGKDADVDNQQQLTFSPDDWYYYVYYPAGRPREMKYARLSHWANRTGIDKGEPSIARYAFHSTIGSRGVFSLAPIWVFGVIGACALCVGARKEQPGARVLGVITILLTCVFFWFFMTRDQGDRNYGGICCYPRWFFPLIPLFASVAATALDRCAKSKVLRMIAYCALFVSVASAFYPSWSPWVSPWFYQFAVDWNWMKPY